MVLAGCVVSLQQESMCIAAMELSQELSLRNAAVRSYASFIVASAISCVRKASLGEGVYARAVSNARENSGIAPGRADRHPRELHH